ncbi:MAG: dynamin family protein [Bryobacteraceae bacterium]|nr:dynamin family protein [Bryobacteraceae bacterium]
MEARPDLLSATAELERLAAACRQESIRCSARELARKIEQNRFHLVVVGQFKRGKTMLLNALLGEAILPVAVLPLTSVVTVLRYGEPPRGTVHFHSGRQLEIRVDQLRDFVTENGNPRNLKGVSYVEVFYPSPYLRGGVTLVDTPGVASVYAHNTQITYDFLPRIDAAIFVTSPEPPLTSSEVEFLTHLKEQVSRIFVIMNKADLVEAAQLAEVLDFVRRSLPEGLRGDGQEILTVSARQALEAKRAGDAALLERSGFPVLEERLNRFLRDEKDRVLQASVSRSLSRLIAELRILLGLQIQATRMPVEELRLKIAEFNEHLRMAEGQRQDNVLLLRGGLARLSAAFEEAARSFAESQVGPLAAAARAHFESLRSLPRKKLADAMDRFVAERIRAIFDPWRRQFEASATEEFRQVTGRFQTAINRLIQQVRETAGSLFGLALGHFEAPEELADLEPTGYYTDSLLDWGLGNAPLLLPKRLFHSYLLRRVLKALPLELDRNATRVAYDFKRRLNTSAAAFQQAMEAKLEETIAGIRSALQSALERHETGSAEAAEAIAKLTGTIQELNRLQQALGDNDSADGRGGPRQEGQEALTR